MRTLYVFCFIITFTLMINLVFAQTEVTFYTTKGNFVVQLEDKLTPITSGNFISLVESEYYDGVIFHRVIDNFMIQGGDPTGTGSGGPGYAIDDEFHSSLSNVRKTISMANSGPNTGGSQFFINLVNNTYLDYDKNPLTSKHPVFGEVILNFSVVQDIGKVKTDASNRPLTDVVMDSLRITKVNGLSRVEFEKGKLQVYPNPVVENSLVSFTSSSNKVCEFTIYDQFGRMMNSVSKPINAGLNSFLISELIEIGNRKGSYYLIVTDGTTMMMQTMILCQ